MSGAVASSGHNSPPLHCLMSVTAATQPMSGDGGRQEIDLAAVAVIERTRGETDEAEDQSGRDDGVERLRASRSLGRHRARNEQDGAEVRCPVGERVQRLQRNEHGERRVEPHDGPAQHGGRSTGGDELGRLEAAHHRRGKGKEDHLGGDADGPQRSDPRRREPLRLPVQRAERVERRVRAVGAADRHEEQQERPRAEQPHRERQAPMRP